MTACSCTPKPVYPPAKTANTSERCKLFWCVSCKTWQFWCEGGFPDIRCDSCVAKAPHEDWIRLPNGLIEVRYSLYQGHS